MTAMQTHHEPNEGDTLLDIEPKPRGRHNVLIELQASNETVRETLIEIRTKLAHHGYSEDFLQDCGIVLAELLNNIVEHAYQDTGEGVIELTLDMHPGALNVVVRDQGVPMPHGRLPEKKQADIDVERLDLPEGGFGWFMIYELVDRLSYSFEDGCNVVSLVISASQDA